MRPTIDTGDGDRRCRRWNNAEDDLIRRAAQVNATAGLMHQGYRDRYAARLRDVAARLGRTYAAVRKRASRLGIRSYRSHR